MLLIVSNGFLKSKWCSMEISLAESTCLNRMLTVVLEPLDTRYIPASMRRILSTQTYLEWTADSSEQPKFWKALRKALTTEPAEIADCSTE